MSEDGKEKEEDVRLEWRDWVALTIAMLETVLLPLVLIIIILVLVAAILLI
ncbi:MAG: hypothetical protein LYZ66_03155 [Nitrososphaerales archaeon]|nr:hypothetical protein [Nitrososphaerales archaeon]